MTITQVITPLPAAPSPSSDTPAVFSEKAAASVLAQQGLPPEINAWAAQANALAIEVSDNAAMAATAGSLVTLASAAANFKGNWSSLSGALAMPASVSYASEFWALNANTANVATDVPGVSAKWSRLRLGPGGSTKPVSAVNITLTNTSTRVQSVSMSATDKYVTLPAANLMSEGGDVFFIKNAGDIQFTVRDSAATVITVLEPGESGIFYLSDNSTSAGVWAVGIVPNSLGRAIYQAPALNVNAVSSTYVSVAALSATQAIVAFKGTSGYLQTCTLNIAGNVVTAGAVLTVNAVASAFISVTAMSATQAIVVYQGTSQFAQACTLNVSGTTVTAGAILAINAVVSYTYAVLAVSATQAVVAMAVAPSIYVNAFTLNVSGTTLTAGAGLQVRADNSSGITLAFLSATQVIVSSSSSSGFLQVCTLNISGTTLTAGAALTLTGYSSLYPSMVGISSSQAIIAYSGATPTFYLHSRVLTVSGTAVTAGPILTQALSPLASIFSSLAKLSATKAMILTSVDGTGTANTYGARAQVLGASDSMVQAGTDVSLKAAAGSFGCLATLTPTKALAVYLESSGYVQARVLELGA